MNFTRVERFKDESQIERQYITSGTNGTLSYLQRDQLDQITAEVNDQIDNVWMLITALTVFSM